MPWPAVERWTNCSKARIRTRLSACSRGGARLATVPPWQNSATPRVSPCAGCCSRDWACGARPGSGVSGSGGSWGSTGSAPAAAAAERVPGAVAELARPEQAVADRGGSAAALERLADAAQQPGGEGDEEGQQDPGPEPAGEEEPHVPPVPRQRPAQSAYSSD